MSDKPKCPKCQHEMLEGWIAEIGKATKPSQWVEGKPESSLWSATKMPKDKTFEIITFGCSSCGYLESYAKQST